MNSHDSDKKEEIFTTASELPENQRDEYLSVVCGDDVELRREIETLLETEKVMAQDESAFLEENLRDKVLNQLGRKLSPGDIISGKYEIVDFIDEGGMGEVYLALDLEMEKMPVALKFFKSYDPYASELHHNKQEIKVLVKLKHQNIVRVLTAGNDKGIPYIVTEFIEGDTLRKKLQSPIDLAKVVNIILQVAAALEEAHGYDIVHRDIKPENIMFDEQDRVKVVDFGIAKFIKRKISNKENIFPASSMQQSVSNYGTLNYISPEQLYGEEPDERSDIWSLGVCLFEMLEGRNPFSEKTNIGTIAAILKVEPPTLGKKIPPELKEIVGTALKKNPEERYQNITEFSRDIRRFKQRMKSSSSIFNTGSNRFFDWLRSDGMTFFIILVCLYLANLAVVAFLSLKEFPAAGKTWKETIPGIAIATGSAFHLVIIMVTLVYYWLKPGLKNFPSIDNDFFEKNKKKVLKNHIVSSTGYKNLGDWSTARGVAERASNQFRKYWKALLLVWLALYVIIFADKTELVKNAILSSEILNQNGGEIVPTVLSYIFNLLRNTANNLNTLCVALLFLTLNNPIATRNKKLGKDSTQINEETSIKNFFLIAALLVGLPLTYELLLLIVGFEYALKAQETYIGLISGVCGGVAMSLLFGRFQSRFLKTSPKFLICLYIYTAIQTLYIFFNQTTDPNAKLWTGFVINCALFLKCLLILLMFWLFQSGRLLFYLVRIRRADDQMDNEWDDFYEVIKAEN